MESPLAIVSKNGAFVLSTIRPEPRNILWRLTYLERLAKLRPRKPAFRSANISLTFNGRCLRWFNNTSVT